jgi:hypothetical protein
MGVRMKFVCRMELLYGNRWHRAFSFVSAVVEIISHKSTDTNDLDLLIGSQKSRPDHQSPPTAPILSVISFVLVVCESPNTLAMKRSHVESWRATRKRCVEVAEMVRPEMTG